MSRSQKNTFPKTPRIAPDFFSQKRYMQAFEIAEALEVSKPTASRMLAKGCFGPTIVIDLNDKRKVTKALSLNVLKYLQGDYNFLPLVDPNAPLLLDPAPAAP